MGKIKDGHSYMETVKIIRKIDDIPELKDELITISDSKSHIEMSKYSLLLAEHILEVSKVERSDAIDECFAINKKWQAGEAKFQDARQVAFMINRLAREDKDPIKEIMIWQIAWLLEHQRLSIQKLTVPSECTAVFSTIRLSSGQIQEKTAQNNIENLVSVSPYSNGQCPCREIFGLLAARN